MAKYLYQSLLAFQHSGEGIIMLILQTPATVELGARNAALHGNIGYIAALIFSAGHESFNSFILELDSFSLLVALTISSKWSSSTLDRGAVLACLLISLVQGRHYCNGNTIFGME